MTLQLRDAQSGSDSALSLALGTAAFVASLEGFIPIQHQILKAFQHRESRALSHELRRLPVSGQIERPHQQNGSEVSAPLAHTLVAHLGASRAIEVLREFREEDAKDQQETLQFLVEALDEQRPEGCKIFSKT